MKKFLQSTTGGIVVFLVLATTSLMGAAVCGTFERGGLNAWVGTYSLVSGLAAISQVVALAVISTLGNEDEAAKNRDELLKRIEKIKEQIDQYTEKKEEAYEWLVNWLNEVKEIARRNQTDYKDCESTESFFRSRIVTCEDVLEQIEKNIRIKIDGE